MGSGTRTLFVASTGGHLDELIRLSRRLDPAAESAHWITAETDQSRELLASEAVTWMPVVAPKDVRGALTCLPRAARIIAEQRPDRVVSTGAALAAPFFAAARIRGVPCHYVESAARSAGPSLTGRWAARLPGVHLYTQYAGWAGARWRLTGSVFDGFEASDDPAPLPEGGLRRVVVTLGTQGGFSFRRAVDALVRVLPAVCAPDAEILWQTGGTDVSGLDLDARPAVPPSELCDAAAAADLVIGHAGVGSALLALDTGRCPVLLPRRRAYREHTDDHQLLIADELSRRGLAVPVLPEALDAKSLLRAAGTRVAPGPVEPVRLT